MLIYRLVSQQKQRRDKACEDRGNVKIFESKPEILFSIPSHGRGVIEDDTLR